MNEFASELRHKIGKAVSDERNRRGWSLADVSRETGGRVPRYSVNRIERGTLRDVAMITLVLSALGFKLPEFMMPDEELVAA